MKVIFLLIKLTLQSAAILALVYAFVWMLMAGSGYSWN